MTFGEGYMLASIGAVAGGVVGALTAYLWGFARGWGKCSEFHHAMNESLYDTATAAISRIAEEARQMIDLRREEEAKDVGSGNP